MDKLIYRQDLLPSIASRICELMGLHGKATKYADIARKKNNNEANFRHYLYCLMKSGEGSNAIREVIDSDFASDYWKAEMMLCNSKEINWLEVKLLSYLRKWHEAEEALFAVTDDAAVVEIECLNLQYFKGSRYDLLKSYEELFLRTPHIFNESIVANIIFSELYRNCGEMYKAELFRFKALDMINDVLKKESIIQRWKNQGLYVNECNLCGSKDFSTSFKRPDGLDIVCCNGCGLYFINPFPEKDMLKDIYNRQYYIGGNVFGYKNNYFKKSKKIIWEQRLSIIEAYMIQGQGRRILDIGCADGAFLDICREKGWTVKGVDLSKAACEEAGKKGIDVFCGELKAAKFAEGSFDCIVLWDLIEHVPDPMKELAEMERILDDCGLLVLATPNLLKSYIMGKNWPGFNFSYEHLYYFSPDTILSYIQKNHLNIELCFSYERGNFNMEKIGHILFVLARKGRNSGRCVNVRLSEEYL